MVTLENESLTVELTTLGAELTKIYSKETQLDYLWKGDASFWKRHAPILFPIVGKLKNNTYSINNKEYQLTQHGFARDEVFSIASQSNTQITFELSHSLKTLDKYPFKFTLQVSYKLIAQQIEVIYKVLNTDTKAIYFSIGAHPAFNCPLTPNSSFHDYYVEFEQKETPTQLSLDPSTGFRNGESNQVSIGKQLPLNYDLFKNDAVIFEDIQSQKVSLKSTKHSHGIHLYIPNWEYLAFWTKRENTPFICFEPWLGITDGEDSTGNFKGKKGIIELPTTNTFESTYTFEFF
ncbi:Galactose mutarotase [Tenacibaculum sp. 190524A02b]|uniref:Aldose 1-epimerase n=1 Tax=Tenacibaculum vairaonense TaxID=3137860 RepID=A0ABM9PS83_9FLAO